MIEVATKDEAVAHVRKLAHALPQASVDASMEAFHEEVALERLKPKTADIKETFKRGYRETEDGKYTVDLKGRKELQTWREMRTQWRHRAVEKMHKDQAKVERVKVLAPDGIKEVRADMEGVAARQPGIRPKVFWGRGRRVDLSKYDPSRPLRTAAEIRGW